MCLFVCVYVLCFIFPTSNFTVLIFDNVKKGSSQPWYFCRIILREYRKSKDPLGYIHLQNTIKFILKFIRNTGKSTNTLTYNAHTITKTNVISLSFISLSSFNNRHCGFRTEFLFPLTTRKNKGQSPITIYLDLRMWMRLWIRICSSH